MIKYTLNLNLGSEVLNTGKSITANEVVETCDAAELAREIAHYAEVVNERTCKFVLDNLLAACVQKMSEGKPQFKVGDKVRVRPNDTHSHFVKQYDNCIGKIVGTNHEYFVVIVTGAFQDQFLAEELELVEETSKHEFKTFDRVLVRDEDSARWKPVFYGYYDKENDPYFHICSDGCGWKQCIPYEGNEHLAGETNMPTKD